MAEEVGKIILKFTDFVVNGNDFTVVGIETAFVKFCESIKVQEVKRVSRYNPGFVKSSIEAAIDAAKHPVVIPYKVNDFGNKECTIIPGLIVKELGPGDAMAIGVQDGPRIAPLSITQLLACRANGFKFDADNTVGSAKFASSELGIKSN